MSDLVKFNIPAWFVTTHALPTASELAYGYRHRWLSETDVVDIALAKYEDGVPLMDAEEELALLHHKDLNRLPGLIAELERQSEKVEDSSVLWLVLALAWLRYRRASFEDPLGIIEMLYTDFGYPGEIEGLVRYMPIGQDEPVGVEAIEKRWQAYIERKLDSFQRRLRGNVRNL